jgi:hypothetical protein
VTEPNTITVGMPWSGMELDDLECGLRLGVSLDVIADFIARDVDEVQQKAEDLGILPVRKRVPKDCTSARSLPGLFGLFRNSMHVAARGSALSR